MFLKKTPEESDAERTPQ